MATIDFAQVFNDLKKGIVNIAEQDVKDYVNAAVVSGTYALNFLKPQLEKWKEELEKGQIDAETFEWNLQCAAESVKMTAMEQVGIAQVQMDKFRKSMMDLIVTTLTAFIP